MKVHAKSEDFVSSVRQAVVTLLPNGYPAVDRVARFLGMHPRTLQRRLAESGTKYSRVVDDVRVATALRLIEHDRFTLAQIARILGYSDPAHFTRAFSRWKGITPRDYRLRSSNESALSGTAPGYSYHKKHAGTEK